MRLHIVEKNTSKVEFSYLSKYFKLDSCSKGRAVLNGFFLNIVRSSTITSLVVMQCELHTPI